MANRKTEREHKYTILGTVFQTIGGKRTKMLKVKYSGADWWVFRPLDYFKKK